MRAVPTIAIALVAGVVGAFAANRMRASDTPATPPEQPRIAQPKMIVPPGWDRRYVQPPGEPDRAPAPESEPRVAQAPASEREQDKLAHYQRELATQDTRLADHGREALDASWSTSSTDRLRATAAELSINPRVIDCRTTTCVASLEFPTPAEALTFLHSRDMSKLTHGFSGMTSTPAPPTSAGAYELTVVFER